MINISQNQYVYNTIWGDTIKIEGISKDLINNNIMKRIKDVDQSGPARFFGPQLPKFTRYDHCLGVMALVSKTKCTKKEQVAALLHDTSHTVFSHVSDYLFTDKESRNKYANNSYQDSIHMQYIKNAKLSKILNKYGLQESDLNPEHTDYKALDQPLPDMCADRIEYNLHTGVLFNLISKEEAKNIVDDLKYKNQKWYFTNPMFALKLAELSLYFTQNFWGAKWNISMNIHLAAALRRALHMKLIQYKHLYLTDTVIMRKLLRNQDKYIQTFIQQCRQPLNKIPGQKYEVLEFKPKFRGIDPLVQDPKSGKIVRLTELNIIFQNHYDSVREWCQKGYSINVLKDAYESNII